MSKIVLKSVKVPNLRVINIRTPENQKMLLSMKYGQKKPDEKDAFYYVGKCILEICIESERDFDKKTFSIIAEVEGTFWDKSGNAEHDERRDAIIRELLPHAHAILNSLLATAKLPSFIPESILPEFDE